MFGYLEHTADIKIRVKETNDFDFFSDIVKAVNSAIFEIKPSKYSKEKEFILEAKSYDLLLHDFIDELIYIANNDFSHTDLINISVEKKKDQWILICKLGLSKVKEKDFKLEIKAVSFNILYQENNVTNEKICEFILDI